LGFGIQPAGLPNLAHKKKRVTLFTQKMKGGSFTLPPCFFIGNRAQVLRHCLPRLLSGTLQCLRYAPEQLAYSRAQILERRKERRYRDFEKVSDSEQRRS
jgi:hypothetical protein